MLRTSLGLVGVGTAVGIVAGFALTRTLSSMLCEVRAADPLVFAAVALGLLGLGLAAARRAPQLYPRVAMQAEQR